MHFEVVDKNKKKVNQFLALTKKIYNKRENMENASEIKKILLGIHPLNKYFSIVAFLIYKNKKVVGRFAITKYPNDTNGYLGFFECIDDSEVAKYLFDTAYNYCKMKNYTKIVGPVDTSFWLKYRLKINMFKRPYTGEPYNKDYYQKLFLNNKYQVIEHYTSNVYDALEDTYDNIKYSSRFREFTNKGYIIRSPKMEEYDNVLKKIYYLLSDLYSDFPIYKEITEQDFLEIFKSYKKIINLSMVKVAYYKDELVGFFISVPNYHNIVYHLNILNILKILNLKRKPKSYVMLYMGVSKEHQGLGKAITQSIMNELRISKLPSIGALARDGKVTQNYVADKIENKYEYILLERTINND